MKNDLSYKRIWASFIEANHEYKKREIKDIYHFCYDESTANELAELVRAGIKRATSSLYLLYGLENNTHNIPQFGDLSIITDYYGNPCAIIENTFVEIIPFNKVTVEFAYKEGEGDKSLDYWKRVHKKFFSKELKKYGIDFNENMFVVLEHFEVIYTHYKN